LQSTTLTARGTTVTIGASATGSYVAAKWREPSGRYISIEAFGFTLDEVRAVIGQMEEAETSV
jgi:hypothetical protein